MYSLVVEKVYLSETKVLASSSHGGVERLAEVFVGFILGQIELWHVVSIDGSNKKKR
jgi:hypothetical protein